MEIAEDFHEKEPRSMMLQGRNSAILKAETANIRAENLFSLLKFTEKCSTLMEIS